jgi:DNA polymerase III epsilon subunit-like protein
MKYFIDFEATQFSNEIIAIGCVREDGAEFYSLVHTKKKLNNFITELTGLTQEMIDVAPSSDEVFTKFFDWCSENDSLPEFYCYGNSDKDFVKSNFKKTTCFKAGAILGCIYTSLIDYSSTVKAHFGLIQNIALAKVVEYYRKEEIVQAHNALDDAKMLKEVYDHVSGSPMEFGVFPEYQAKEAASIVIDGQIKDEDLAQMKILRMKGGQVIEEYATMTEAITWVYNQIPDSDPNKPNMILDRIGRNIKKANRNKTKYFNCRWRLEAK